MKEMSIWISSYPGILDIEKLDIEKNISLSQTICPYDEPWSISRRIVDCVISLVTSNSWHLAVAYNIYYIYNYHLCNIHYINDKLIFQVDQWHKCSVAIVDEFWDDPQWHFILVRSAFQWGELVNMMNYHYRDSIVCYIICQKGEYPEWPE